MQRTPRLRPSAPPLLRLAAGLVLLPAVAPASPRVEPGPLDVRVSPVVQLWFEVRALAEDSADPPEELLAAVEAARALEAELAHPLGFSLVEGLLPGCERAEDLPARFEALPETRTLPLPGGAREVRLREPALALAVALAEVAPDFLAREWPAREAELARAREELLERLDAPAQAQALGLLGSWLGVETAFPSPVYLVTRAPRPGGVTVRTRSGAASFVATEDRPPVDLAEVVLHEVLHGLDVASPGSRLSELRSGLQDAGIDPARTRDVVHQLFFLAAGEAVRRAVDAGHVDYGERTGLYARSREADRIVRPAAERLFAGEVEPHELVELVVSAAAGE